MPQTEEHLDILHLLGTRRGIFVITKADLADTARLRDVRDEIELLADGTTLAGAPVIEVSSITGIGLDTLRAEIVRQLDGFQARRATGVFRLPLDRAFVIKGHGIVVTGTAMGAEVRVGQKLRVLRSGDEVRVRSIQVHSESVESAGLCQRVALNLTGAEKLELARGDVLADERLDSATARFDGVARDSSRREARAQEQHPRAFVHRHNRDHRARDRARRRRRDCTQVRQLRAARRRRCGGSRSRATVSSSATKPIRARSAAASC